MKVVRPATLIVTLALLAGACSSNEPADPSTPSSGSAEPVTFQHAYGETVIPPDPQRVVSLGYNEHEFLLPFGIKPIYIMDRGQFPESKETGPWSADLWGDVEPQMFKCCDLNIEEIASLQPDLIMAMGYGINKSQYETLSKIAPTVAHDPDALTWQDYVMNVGTIFGQADEAEEMIAEVDDAYAAAREAHPEWEGLSASVVGAPGPDWPAETYSPLDGRGAVIEQLGFEISPEIAKLTEKNGYATISQEELGLLDADLMVWSLSLGNDATDATSMRLRPTLRAYEEGREMVWDDVTSIAISIASPQGQLWAIEGMLPEIEAAVDGDPSTVVPTAEENGFVS